MEPATVVLIHGAWGGSWSWERVVPFLEARGIPSVAVDLPSVGADPGDQSGLAGDVAAVTSVLDEREGPYVVCCHSYGGMVGTWAAAGRTDVSHLVYLCAFMPEVGDSLAAITGGPAPWIELLEDGRTIPNEQHIRVTSYADCDPEIRASAAARLRPQVAKPFGDPVPVAAWHTVPSTYVVCTQDESLPPELQRDVFAKRAGTVIEVEASHTPHFSRPEWVAAVLAERAA